MDVSVIIVNYNTCDLLDNCLDSIRDKTHGIKYEVIVVDNASSDNSINMVHHKYPWVKLIESESNIGFGRANNLGFIQSTGKNIFLLNSDTILIENSIKILNDFLNGDNSIGAVGAILIGEDYQNIHSYGDFPSIRRKLFGKKFLHSVIDVKKPKSVDYITGADIMIPRLIWIELNGFDPNFFLYYEETDLQKRMSMLGYKRIIVPSTRIIHLEGESSKLKTNTREINVWKNVTMFKSMIYYMKKHSMSVFFMLLKHLLILKYKILYSKEINNRDYYQQIIKCLKEI